MVGKEFQNSSITFVKYNPRGISSQNPHQFWAGQINGAHINISIEKNNATFGDEESYNYKAVFNQKRTENYNVKESFICSGDAETIKKAQRKVKNEISSTLQIHVQLDRSMKYRTYPDLNKI